MDSLSQPATLLAANPVVFIVIVGLLGLLVGSFLNVVIHRLPIMLETNWRQQCDELQGVTSKESTSGERFNLMVPRSRCPHCGHHITALENIPVLSFLALKGRCAGCGARIAWRYPAVEMLSGLLSALVAWHFGFHAATLAALLLTWTLIALSFIDFDTQILPDTITLPGLWLGLFVNSFAVFTPLHSAVFGAIAGYLSLWAVFHLFRLATGKEGMGYGDFKLFALAGAWLGWQALLLTIMLASISGAVIGIALIVGKGHDRAKPIPFGPFLCIGTWVALLWGNEIIDLYLGMAGIG